MDLVSPPYENAYVLYVAIVYSLQSTPMKVQCDGRARFIVSMQPSAAGIGRKYGTEKSRSRRPPSRGRTKETDGGEAKVRRLYFRLALHRCLSGQDSSPTKG